MSLKIWFLLKFGFVNYLLQIRAEDENNTCAAHEEWTVFQRRKYGNVDFYRDWDDYVNGFGDCDGDFWLGLEPLHQATKGGDMELEINMMSKGKRDHLVAEYSTFRVGPGSDSYRLTISGYSGNSEDAFSRHDQRQFTTRDADHDGDYSLNCAVIHEGGWWYSDCGRSNLNGNFNKGDGKGIWWQYNRRRRQKRSCFFPYVSCPPRFRDHFIYEPIRYVNTYTPMCCSEMKFRKRSRKEG